MGAAIVPSQTFILLSGVFFANVFVVKSESVKDIIRIGNSCTNNKQLILGKRLRGDKTPLRSKVGNMITRFMFRI